MITKSEIHPQSYQQKSIFSTSRSSDSGRVTPPRTQKQNQKRHITTDIEIPNHTANGQEEQEAEGRYPTKKPGDAMARLYGGGGDSLASGGAGGDVPKIILRRDTGDHHDGSSAGAARPAAAGAGAGESLGNGFGPALVPPTYSSSSTWTTNGGENNNIFGVGGGGLGQNQNSNLNVWMSGAAAAGGAGSLLGDNMNMTSPALGSVETAASTQPPPSPLSPSAAGGSDEQGHQMLWARSGSTSTSTTGAGAAAAGGASSSSSGQQQQQAPAQAQSSLWGSPAMGGVDASAAPWWPSPAGGSGGGSGPNPSAGTGGGAGSGSASAASSTATTPISNRQQQQQQQHQAQANQYQRNQQGQYQQQMQHHRRSNSWNQDEALATMATGLSTPGHSPPRSGKKWKRGQPGAGAGDSAGSSPSDQQKGGQPPVDYTQPVSLEEAQAIAAAQQQGGAGPAAAAIGPWGTPQQQQQQQQHRLPPSHHQQQQGGPAIGPTSPQGPPSWVMGPGGGPGPGHGQQAYHHQQSAPSPYVLRPRPDDGGDGRGGEYPLQHHQHHPPRPPHQHPHQHQYQHQQDQHRPPLQHHVSAPASAPTSPQRGPVSSHPSPGHPSASGGAGAAHHEHHPSTGTGRGGGVGGHHQPHPHGSGDRPPQHQQHRESHHPPTSSSSSGSRAPSEVLKTLLRKKACLYEPNTSHAIATVTWLVGRNLTMSRGYFTRQSLQTGVHNVVDAKINAGAITRTKVNRCMQIILNSCFHYIIPRVDGSEEDGTAFSVEFIKTARVGDDATLLESLPPPWNDLEVPMEIAADPDEEEEVVVAPKSGRRGSLGSTKGGGGYLTSKRSVLLCFNENVRCAQDVFRCHNEFIRDAAHSSNLHLTAEEWKSFFSGGVSPASPRFGPTPSGGKAPSTVSTGNSTPTSTGMSVSPASLSPAGIRPSNEGDVDTAGIQPPALTLGSAWTQAPGPTISLLPRMTKEKDAVADHDEGDQKGPTAAYRPAPLTGDVLGELTPVDLDKFRTTWCAKRYEHDPSICSFAHVEINGGWLRRDPVLFRYSPEMCPDIVSAAQVLGTTNVPAELKGCLFNRCPRGKNCDKAHSREEVQYHPDVYKKALCPSVRKSQEQDHGHHHHHHHGGKSSKQPCKLRDICPLLHPPGSVQPKEHHHGHGHHHHRGKGSGPSSGKNAAQAPALTAASGGPPIPGAPMLYIGPAPPSDFDAYLQMPGLQELFRRRSANLFHYYHKSSAGHTVGTYNIFGDNLGLSTEDGA